MEPSQKLEGGQLTLTGTNTYNGGTYIIGGVLQFAATPTHSLRRHWFAQNSIFISSASGRAFCHIGRMPQPSTVG